MATNAFNLLVLFRVSIGMLLLFSGFQKASLPYQNFLYAIQIYDLLPSVIEEWTARVFPWVEIALGLFLCAGLWVRWSALAAAGAFLLFIFVIGQALVRGLPVDECGCFGEMISVPPHWMIGFDSLMFAMLLLIFFRHERAGAFSLDRVLE